MLPETNVSSDNDAAAAVLGAIIGIFGGFFLLSLLGEKRQECPVCGNSLENGISVCPHCGAVLQWS